MDVRCFDLGGSGLKTCLCRTGNRLHGQTTNLGRSPDRGVNHWSRNKLQTLDKEIENGVTFSFSLAGLDKLSDCETIPNLRDRRHIAQLFGLPERQVYTLNDGDAHLLASRSWTELPTKPQINFCVGTAVGIGVCKEDGSLVSEENLRRKFDGKDLWEIEVQCDATDRVLWFALGGKGLKELTTRDPVNGVFRFEERWLKFLNDQLFPFLSEAPQLITFTGGVVDSGSLFRTSTRLDGCKITKGPLDAGLLGALVNASPGKQTS